MNFATIAPYLKDPLVLAGFALFLAFLFARQLLSSGIIPPVGAALGAGLLRLLFHYGFIIGLLVVVLGFGLKYRELSEQEQRAAVSMMRSELTQNAHVVEELRKNTQTLYGAAATVAKVLRIEKLKINFLLFPVSNIDPDAAEDADLYNKRFDALLSAGLLADPEEVRRFREQNSAVVRTVERTMSTIRSLGDRQALRYVIHREAYDANLPMLRRVSVADISTFAAMYAKTSEVREEYFRVAQSVADYLTAVRAYCASARPERASLAAVLASERLTMRLLAAHSRELTNLADQVRADISHLE